MNGLPPVSEAGFDGRPPWTVISTRTLVTSLGIGDRGLFATWRCRGIGPDELPASWFRPASGRPNYYLITDVLAWLAHRQGEPFDTKAYWFAYLGSVLGDGFATLVWVRRMAERDGLVRDDVRFTTNGRQRYLELLSSK